MKKQAKKVKQPLASTPLPTASEHASALASLYAKAMVGAPIEL